METSVCGLLPRDGSQEFHFTNTGLVDADTASQVPGKQVVANSGTIIGDIVLGDGSNVYHGEHGIFKQGTIYGKTGQDVIVGGASKKNSRAAPAGTT